MYCCVSRSPESPSSPLTLTTWMMKTTRPLVLDSRLPAVFASTCMNRFVLLRSCPCASPAGESALFKRSAKASLEARLAEKREKQAPAPLRKRDMVASAIGKVFGAFW
jgi:hypothetical protein